MNVIKTTFAIIAVTLMFSNSAIAAPCTSKADCTGANICCMDASWQEAPAPGIQKTGACMSRNACFSDNGVNVLYEASSPCEEGTVYCTVSVSKGRIRGCFAPDLCEPEPEPEAEQEELLNNNMLFDDIKPKYQPGHR